jgi:hypothetical protein
MPAVNWGVVANNVNKSGRKDVEIRRRLVKVFVRSDDWASTRRGLVDALRRIK